MSRINDRFAQTSTRKPRPGTTVDTPLKGEQEKRQILREAVMACGHGATRNQIDEWIRVHYGAVRLGDTTLYAVKRELLKEKKVEAHKILDWKKAETDQWVKEQNRIQKEAEKAPTVTLPAQEPETAKDGIPDDYQTDEETEGSNGLYEELSDEGMSTQPEPQGIHIPEGDPVITPFDPPPAVSGKVPTSVPTDVLTGDWETRIRKLGACRAAVRIIGSPDLTIELIKMLKREEML